MICKCNFYTNQIKGRKWGFTTFGDLNLQYEMEEVTEYLTVVGKSEGLYKDKGSKFIAIAVHVENEVEIKQVLDEIRKTYYDARHHCYAYRINPEDEQFRANDDGEPSGTAGKPILNQLLSHKLINTLVVVVRYFGGTKLGVSGLIAAYKTATIDALNNIRIVKKFITNELVLGFEYPLMNSVMRIIKDENLKIKNQNFESDCKIYIDLKKNQENIVLNKVQKLRGVTVTYL